MTAEPVTSAPGPGAPGPGTPRAVVVGAGIGGQAAALGLQRGGWQVQVLERRTADEAAAQPGSGAVPRLRYAGYTSWRFTAPRPARGAGTRPTNERN